MATAMPAKLSPGKTVLIVDDSSAMRAALRDLFLSDGFALCVDAEDGLKALAIAQECKPDLIILDMSMPVMNGLTAAPKLKELVPSTPIILFSLHADFLKGQNLSALGIAATFSKGDAFDGLLEKAHELVSK
jgi:chemotaxis response regulator CheB